MGPVAEGLVGRLAAAAEVGGLLGLDAAVGLDDLDRALNLQGAVLEGRDLDAPVLAPEKRFWRRRPMVFMRRRAGWFAGP